jgi:hypothetical protein
MSPKPRALRYADALESAEQRIVDALPDILDKLIEMAKAGDLKAAAYLCDRVWGRAAGAKAAPADDRELPYDDESFKAAAEDKAEREALSFGMFGRLTGANNGA